MSVFSRLLSLLTPEQRRKAAILLCLMVFGAGLETLGVALVIPAIGVMTRPDLANQITSSGRFGFLDGFTHSELVATGVLALVALHAVKAFYLGLLAWLQSRFVFGIQEQLSRRLFASYLAQPWTFHLQRNSALLIRNITGETDQLTHNGLLAGMILITEFMVVAGIGVLLVFSEPAGALIVVSVLAASAWGYQRLTKRHVLDWGQARQFHEGQRILHLQQGLGGLKDIKLLGREREFCANYEVHNRITAKVAQRQMTLQQVPRLWLELLAVSGLALLVLVMLGQRRPIADLLPTLGLFAAAAFRIMPSATRVLWALQGIRYGRACIDTLYEEMASLAAPVERRGSPLPPMSVGLVARGLSFRYPDSDADVLASVDVDIPKGRSIGFVGGSGSGKSSLVDILLGLLPPSSGQVLVDGREIADDLRGWQDQIGYVPQMIYLTDDTLRRNVAFGVPDGEVDEVAVWRAVRAAQLEQFVNSLPEGLDTQVGERGVRLSGGQRQRIGIARALYHDPEVLVLDEATSALDNETEADVMDAVNAMHGMKTLIIVAHRLSTVAHCDYIYRVEAGSVSHAHDIPIRKASIETVQ